MTLPPNKTKIVCTIGPASETPEIMEQMIRAGMNVARLNFSHGSFDSHRKVIAGLRQAAKKTGERLAIMADLPGPKMRIGDLAEEPVDLIPGAPFTLTAESVLGDAQRVSMTFAPLPEVVKPGDTLYLNDGLIQLEVREVVGLDVRCRVIVGGELRSRKGLNLPGIDLGISAFTARDHECLKFAVENGIDAVSQSFVEKAADIERVREAAAALGRVPFIIAKIERSRALERIDEIIEAADGIMVARGDLGVEVPIEEIAVIQKDVMRRANQRAKPVITATQMLESMTANRRPTRAEATDVANAVLDGTDCVMLSGESAMGNYPVEAVAMLAKIAAAAEPFRHPLTVREMFPGLDLKGQAESRPPDRPERGGQPGIRPPGGRFRAHPQRRHRPQHCPLPAAGLDRGRELPGGHLPGTAIFLRGLPGLRTGSPGRLENLYPGMADPQRGGRGPGHADRRAFVQTSGDQSPPGNHRF